MDAETRQRTFSRLIKERDVNEYGTWEIKSEDHGYGGIGDKPIYKSLGLFEGTWEKVVSWAVNMDKFYSWGHGGSIIKMKKRMVTKL